MLGVQFGNLHTGDLGLQWIDTDIGEVKAKTYMVEIPGRDGELDYTGVLTPDVKFENRTLKFTFDLLSKAQSHWQSIYSMFSNSVAGQRLKIILDTDKAWFWIGRCTVSGERESGYGTITVSVDAEPYKYDVFSDAGDNWQWDPFSFVDGVILPTNIAVSGSKSIILKSARKMVQPVITCSVDMTCSQNGKSYSLKAGENKYTGIRLVNGDNTLIFYGYGNVTIRYERGSL